MSIGIVGRLGKGEHVDRRLIRIKPHSAVARLTQ
jgi:hypothetical protein